MTAATSMTGTVDLWPALALRDLLECDARIEPGAPVPLLWHWVFLLDHPRLSDLGDDGHRRRTGADVHLRRMWAGGAVTQHRPLVIGREATRVSREVARETKHGSSGTFTLVSIGHQVLQGGEVCVDEVQRLVYRAPARTEATAAASPQPVLPGERAWRADEVTLFRYSALTYNGHRIHYDRPYANGTEGYPGLLVHGPLQALLMAEHVAAQHNPSRRPATIDYRLVSPLFDGQGCITGASAADAGTHTAYVRDGCGRRTATATVRRLGG